MRSKYRAVKTVVDNITFSSKKEAARYVQLRAMLRAGHIENLELQPRYKIQVNGSNVCAYVADFSYKITSTGQHVVEDVKGYLTPVYRLKKKLVKACCGVEIVEI